MPPGFIPDNNSQPRQQSQATGTPAGFMPDTPSSPLPQQRQGSAVGNFVRDITSPLPRMAANLVHTKEAVKNIAKGNPMHDTSAPVRFPFYGEIDPIGQRGPFPRKVADAVGVGAEAGSWLIGGSAAAKGAAATMGGRFLQGATAALPGGIASGLSFAAGREAQDQEATPKSVTIEGIKGGAIGGVAAGTFGGVFSLGGGTVLLTRKGGDIAREKAEDFKKFIDYKDMQPPEVVARSQADAMKDMIFSDKGGITNRFDDIARRNKMSRDALIENMAEEGYTPLANGKLADVVPARQHLNQKQTDLMEGISAIIESERNRHLRFNLDDIARESVNTLKTHPTMRVREAPEALTQLQRDFERYAAEMGNEISPSQLVRILREQNEATKAYRDKTGLFAQDSHNAIATAIRNKLDDVSPEIRNANREYGRLETYDEALLAMRNQRITTSPLFEAASKYAGLTFLAGIPLGVAGPGSLVIAGAAAHMAANTANTWLRNKVFNPTVHKKLWERRTPTDDVIDAVRREAGLPPRSSSALPSATPGAPRTQVGSGSVIPVAPSNRTMTLPRSQYQIGGEAPTPPPQGSAPGGLPTIEF